MKDSISRDIFNDFRNKNFKTICSLYLAAECLDPQEIPVPKVSHLDKSYHFLGGLKKVPAC